MTTPDVYQLKGSDLLEELHARERNAHLGSVAATLRENGIPVKVLENGNGLELGSSDARQVEAALLGVELLAA